MVWQIITVPLQWLARRHPDILPRQFVKEIAPELACVLRIMVKQSGAARNHHPRKRSGPRLELHVGPLFLLYL